MSLLLFKQIAAMFLMVAVGFLLVKVRVVPAEASRTLSLVCIHAVTPCVIVRSFQLELTGELLQFFLLAVAAAVALHLLVYALGFVLKKAGMDGVERGSVIYSNCANLIFPIVTALLGGEWLVFSSTFFCVQTILMWTHGCTLISGQSKPDWKKLLTNCNIIAVVIGLLLMLLRIPLPALLLTAMDGLGAMLAPASMLIIGMLLSAADLKAIFTQPRVWLVTGLKLLVVPLLALPVLKLLQLLLGGGADTKTLFYTSFLAVSAPTATMVTQLAQLYERRPEYAGAINVMTTLLCIVTMPVLTELYMRFM